MGERADTDAAMSFGKNKGEQKNSSEIHPFSMNWSADFQIGALKKTGMIAPIWKSALRGAFWGSIARTSIGRRRKLKKEPVREILLNWL